MMTTGELEPFIDIQRDILGTIINSQQVGLVKLGLGLQPTISSVVKLPAREAPRSLWTLNTDQRVLR